jgi:hypothetical protein
VPLPDPAPFGGSAEGSQPAAAAAHPSAMTLFAPDPNAVPDSVSSFVHRHFWDCLNLAFIFGRLS